MSSFKVLLMPLGLRGQTAERIQGALAVAQHFQAHLQVLFTYVSPREMIPDGIFGLSQAAMDNLTKIADDQAAESAKQRRDLFEQICQQRGVILSAQPAGQTLTASWQQGIGLRSQLVVQHSLLADLIVVAQPPQQQPSAMIQAALTETGRPVLLMPRMQTNFSADHIVIGWNASAEIARTLDAALPCLKAARTVTVLTTQEHKDGVPSFDDLLTYLSWHGISAAMKIFTGHSTGAALLQEVHSLGADLLIVGGYSRKRSVRDRLKGSVTQHVITHTEIPVLMAH